MMTEGVRLTMKDEKTVLVLEKVLDRSFEIGEAAVHLECSKRTVYRKMLRLREEGPQAVVHGNRGKASPRKIPDTVRDRILELAKEDLADSNDTHLVELLMEYEGISIGRETLRAILRSGGIKPKRKHKSGKHRDRRERKSTFGEMLQIDASPHDWLEDRGPRLALLGAIDDATNRVWLLFRVAETTEGYLSLLRGIVTRHGAPLTLYSDRHMIFTSPKEATIEEQLRGIEPLTQFGRAMDELGTGIINAHSPQAKGRIERLWNTLQDRLVVEMRLAGISTLDEANRFLVKYTVKHNRQFMVKPASDSSSFRPLPEDIDLDAVFSIKEQRTVAHDSTVKLHGRVISIPEAPSSTGSLIGKRVDICFVPDGSILVLSKGKRVARIGRGVIREWKKPERLYPLKRSPMSVVNKSGQATSVG